ncbi:MAG: NAD(P)H-hydrate dehydratase, partial [Parcubacteria group bacterium]
KSGSRALATAGTGDVLTGILATLWAQNIKQPFESASTAVYLHGLAGDKAASKLGKRSVIASDVIEWLPEVTKDK